MNMVNLWFIIVDKSNLIILEGPENLFGEVLDSYKLLNNLL